MDQLCRLLRRIFSHKESPPACSKSQLDSENELQKDTNHAIVNHTKVTADANGLRVNRKKKSPVSEQEDRNARRANLTSARDAEDKRKKRGVAKTV